MKISDSNRGIIVNEFRNASRKMKENEDYYDKLFWFSSTYGIVQRVFNFEFEPILIFTHQTLQGVYKLLYDRISSLITTPDKSIAIPAKEIFDNLEELVENLADNIEKNNDNSMYKNLQKISNLGYIATGNGYYLFLKGLLKI